MILSKSFGYALRSILYVAMINRTRKHVTLNEIAKALGIPRHYLAKIMKRLVKKDILKSIKGPFGGFYLNEITLDLSLIRLAEVTDEAKQFDSCVICTRPCGEYHHCPLHEQADSIKKQWNNLLSNTRVKDLLKNEGEEFVRSISVS
jgi:Rrf2 family transcriptional regulator, iron-sulfur cluster assembly transcription factor